MQAGPWWWRWAGAWWAPWALLAVTLLLGAPAFRVGLLFEDWGQRMLLVGDTFDPLQVFRLARDPEELRAAQGIGLAPWWADPEVRLAFLRPVSALTHRLDWRWWPDAPWAHVLHTFAWWAAAGFAAWRAYLRLLPSRAAAALATFAWAADDARGTAVGWLANRNTFVASAFGLAALALHLRARDTGEAWARWLAVGMLGAALFSAEAGVGACVYLLAVSVALEPRWDRTWRALWPYAFAVGPWLVAWKGLGFGAARSGAYVDPVSEPLRWVVAAAERAPLDWAAQWTGPLATASSMTAFPERVGWLLPAAAVCAAVLGWAAPLARADARSAAALGGSLLALLPVASVFPSERVLAFVGFGASALVARALHDLATAPNLRWLPWRATTWAWAAFALVLGPLGLPFAIGANRAVIGLTTGPWDAWAQGDPTVAGATVVSLTAPCSMCSGYLVPYRLGRGLPAPARWRVVAASWDRVVVTRTGEHTLSVAPEHGFAPPPGAASEWYGPLGPHVLAQQLDATFQAWREPFPVGTTVDVGAFVVRVDTLTDDGRPARVTLTLDGGPVRFVRYTDGRMVDVALPPVGGSLVFEPEGVPFAPFSERATR